MSAITVPSGYPEFCVSLDSQEMSDYYEDDYVGDLVQGLVIPVKKELDTLSMDSSYVSKKLRGEFRSGVPVPEDFGAGLMTQP